MNDWKRESLGKHADIHARIGWRGLSSGEYRSEGPFLIAGQHIKKGRVEWDECDHISDERYVESPEIALKSGDVIISKDGTIGRVARIDDLPARASLNGTMMLVRPKKSLDYRFLFHFLGGHSFQKLIEDKVSGSSIPHLFQRDLVGLDVDLPPKEEQSRIAAVLDTIGEVITKTEAVIAKLKQVRAGLLHNLLTRGLDENGQLRDPVAHPEHFQDSSIGRIPKAWDVLPLGSIATVDRGKFAHRPRNDPAFYGGGFPFIQTGDIALAAGEIITEASQTLNSQGVSVSREFSEGTIAVTIAANIGDTAILGRPMFFPDSIVGVVPIPMHINRWIELTLRDAKKRLNALAPQSAQKNINLEFLRPLLVPVPSSGEQKLCVQVYENITASISTEHHVLVKLSFLKSALMADLLTGRVRVPADLDFG